jgi:hypothetical protein
MNPGRGRRPDTALAGLGGGRVRGVLGRDHAGCQRRAPVPAVRPRSAEDHSDRAQLVIEQPALASEAAAVAYQATLFPDHSVAGDKQRQGVGPENLPHGTRRNTGDL